MLGLRSTDRKLPSLCFFHLIWSGMIVGNENGPDVVKVVVKEGSDVILPCSLSTKMNLGQNLFDWKKDGLKEVFLYDAGFHYDNGRTGQDEQFKGRVSHFPEQLKHGDASIMIRKAKMVDSGSYTCAFPHLQPSQLFHIELVVDTILKDRREEISGAASEPYVRFTGATDGVQQQCEVRGASPKPKVEWQDNAGNILRAGEPKISEREGRYNVTLPISVTHHNTANIYRCVVTQEEIGHQTHAVSYVYLKEDPYTGWLIGGFVLGFVTLPVLLALLVATKQISIIIHHNPGSCQWRKGSFKTPTDDKTLPIDHGPLTPHGI